MRAASSEWKRKESLGSDTCDAVVSLQGLNPVTREHKRLAKGQGYAAFKWNWMEWVPPKARYNVWQSVYSIPCYFLLSITFLTRSLKSQAQGGRESWKHRSVLWLADSSYWKVVCDAQGKRSRDQLKLTFLLLLAFVKIFCQNIRFITVKCFHQNTQLSWYNRILAFIFFINSTKEMKSDCVKLYSLTSWIH